MNKTLKAISSADLSKETLEHFFDYYKKTPNYIIQLAQNPNLNPDIMAKMIELNDPAVMYKLASHKNITPELLSKMVNLLINNKQKVPFYCIFTIMLNSKTPGKDVIDLYTAFKFPPVYVKDIRAVVKRNIHLATPEQKAKILEMQFSDEQINKFIY